MKTETFSQENSCLIVEGKCSFSFMFRVIFFISFYMSVSVQACMFLWRTKVNVGCLLQLLSTLSFEMGALLSIF